MASQANNIDELFRAVEQHQQEYLRSLRVLHESLALSQHSPAVQSSQNQGVRRRERADSRITVHDASFTPPLRALSGPTFTSSSDTGGIPQISQTLPLPGRRMTLDAPGPVSRCPSPLPMSGGPMHGDLVPDEELSFIPLLDQTSSPQQQIPSPRPTPVEDFVPRTTSTLLPMSFSDDMLLQHLRNAEFSDALSHTLEEVEKRKVDLDTALSFRDFAAYEREGYVSATFEVYDVGADATARKTSVDAESPDLVKYAGDAPFENPDGIVDAPTMWKGIKDVNMDGASVGRITIVQEPTPLMLAALHLTMSPYFDMSELLEHFLSDVPNRNKTRAVVNRAFERIGSPSLQPKPTSISAPLTTTSNIRQRSFFFVFKYYTVVGDGLSPAPWQKYDERPSDRRLGDHVDIAECGSILALSLGGEPTKPVRMRPRREKARDGFLYNTFGPWQLLGIQSYPDDQHTVRTEEFQQKSFYNGPYAFLDLLISEYRDAGRRNLTLHEHITKLITPPTQFMFNPNLRDKLLFEDKRFTYIRRYFWAYNTLAVINNGIAAMITAYSDTFNEAFWAGSHQLLWPHPAPHTPEGLAYRDRMAVLRKELEKVVSELGDVLKRNERTRKEIENLRDQLFSGSSIKESRRAIDQGDNIRILTMISMIFLPLTFVTSIWGMTEFDIKADAWPFPLTMALVCVPFILIVLLLQTRIFTRVVRRLWFLLKAPFAWFRPASAVAGPTQLEAQPQGRKRRLMVMDGAKAAAGRWTWWQWSADKGRGLEEGELGRV